MVKSLTDLKHLCSLLSADTSPYSNTISKIPVPGYGTKDSPGQIQIWAISLGSQKDSILNWVGRDVLVRQKNLESAVKYIRSKFMEGRHHSELRQHFNAKLTPISVQLKAKVTLDSRLQHLSVNHFFIFSPDPSSQSTIYTPCYFIQFLPFLCFHQIV